MKVKEAIVGVVLGTAVFAGGVYFLQDADTGAPVAVEELHGVTIPPDGAVLPELESSGEVLPELESSGEVLPSVEDSGTIITE